MNLNAEKDFVIHVKTPSSTITDHVTLASDGATAAGEVAAKWCQDKNTAVKQVEKEEHKSDQSMSYSDSFDSESPRHGENRSIKDDEEHSVKRKLSNSRNLKKRCKVRENFGNIRGNYRKKVHGDSSQSFVKMSEATQKLLEASRVRICELVSENADLRRQLTENNNELRTVQSQNKLQERELKKVTGKEAEVPNLLSRHQAEVRSLQEQLRSKREATENATKRIQSLEKDLEKSRRRLERLRDVCSQEGVPEKKELLERMQQLQTDLTAQNRRVDELEKAAELTNKRHLHQLSQENSKSREIQTHYQEAMLEINQLRATLAEKTKLLEMQNIYSQRVNSGNKLLSQRLLTTSDDSGRAKKGNSILTKKSTTNNSEVPPLIPAMTRMKKIEEDRKRRLMKKEIRMHQKQQKQKQKHQQQQQQQQQQEQEPEKHEQKQQEQKQEQQQNIDSKSQRKTKKKSLTTDKSNLNENIYSNEIVSGLLGRQLLFYGDTPSETSDSVGAAEGDRSETNSSQGHSNEKNIRSSFSREHDAVKGELQQIEQDKRNLLARLRNLDISGKSPDLTDSKKVVKGNRNNNYHPEEQCDLKNNDKVISKGMEKDSSEEFKINTNSSINNNMNFYLHHASCSISQSNDSELRESRDVDIDFDINVNNSTTPKIHNSKENIEFDDELLQLENNDFVNCTGSQLLSSRVTVDSMSSLLNSRNQHTSSFSINEIEEIFID